MLLKGIIRNIDLLSNSCAVEIPTFSKQSGDEVILPAVFSTLPGLSRGYSIGDVVILGFEAEKLSKPIVIGKLFIGGESEANGGIACGDLYVGNSATIPGETKLLFDGDLLNNYSKYKTIADVIDAVNALQANPVGGDGTKVEANPEEIATDVLGKIKIADTVYSIQTGQQATVWGTVIGDITDQSDLINYVTDYVSSNSSKVSVSQIGRALTTVNYITVDGTEYKLPETDLNNIVWDGGDASDWA